MSAGRALARRGPDGQHIWTQTTVGLVYAALHSTPESLNERQPRSLDGKIWITADARIDNRHELRTLLASKGTYISRLASDTEYILRAYDMWEQNCVAYLIGDFAFAIWDTRQNTLFCARDHLGVRLFYYYDDHRMFVFGSEMSGILALLPVKPSIFEPRIADYLVQELEGIDTTCTFYDGIRRLPPGHAIVVHEGKVSINNYWRMQAQPAIRYRHDAEYAEGFLEKFSEAVRCRLRAASPSQVACMLSGGLDSSSIVGIARDYYRQEGLGNFRALSALAHAEDKTDIESHFINVVLAEGHLESIAIRPDEIEKYSEELSYLLENTTDLYDHWMQVPQLMYILAQKHNIKVVLTGIGGDEFAGLPPSYPSYLLRAGHFRRALNEIQGLHRFYSRASTDTVTDAIRYAYHAFTPAKIHLLRQRLMSQRWYSRALERTVIRPSFAERINLHERLLRLWETTNPVRHPNLLSEQLGLVHHPYLAAGLERYNRVGSAYGVETRHPYTDKRLIEFLLAIPPEQLTCDGLPKILVRRTMNNVLTDEVRFRRGIQHLGWQFQTAQFQLESTRFTGLIKDDLSLIGPYVHLSKIHDAYCKFAGGSEGDPRSLWYALTLARWLNRV